MRSTHSLTSLSLSSSASHQMTWVRRSDGGRGAQTILRRVDGRQLEGNRIMLADRREAVHANADGGHVALLGQLGGTLGNVFRRASSRFCTMLVALLREPGGRPAGFPLWPLRNWGIFLAPLLVLGFAGAGRRRPENACVGAPGVGAQKTQGVFGVPRVRATKNPARFPGPGLGTLLKDIFLYMGPVSTSRSHKLKSLVAQRSQVAPRIGCIRYSQEVFVGHPIVGVRPMKIPARFHEYSAKQIAMAADNYLRAHPELIKQAKATIAALDEAKLSNSAQKPKR
jgi:hypothetical protein